jgi:hypothetical protein
MRIGRFTLEILRPIPLTPLRIRTRTVRPGKRVRFATAALLDGRDEVALAAAWSLRVDPADDGGVVPETALGPPDFAGPADSPELPVYAPPWQPSYFDAIEWRFARGSVFEPGPAACWMRMRVPLVAGEEPSPLARVLVAADSGNGISAAFPFERFLFINLDLTVHLARHPRGEWVCLDAATRIDTAGIGFAQSTLWDEHGRFGVGAQSLLVAPRGFRPATRPGRGHGEGPTSMVPHG